MSSMDGEPLRRVVHPPLDRIEHRAHEGVGLGQGHVLAEREILRSYLKDENSSGRLLFPSMVNGREAMLSDCRKLLDRLGAVAKHSKGSLRTRMFRHSYCAARLHTLDGGAPVSLYTVCRELSHESEDMVRRVYAHLGQVRLRSDVVEYRVVERSASLQRRI